MLTILTALRGNHALTARLLGAIQASGMSVSILAAVNNDEDDTLVKEAGGTTIPVTAYTGSDEVERVNHIARIYDELVRGANTDLVVLWDDDVLPPFKGLERINAAMESATPRVGGIVSIYPYANNRDQAVLFWKPYVRGGAAMSSIPPSGLHKVWGGGTGFSIWRTKYLVRTVPWKTMEVDGCVQGWDRDLAFKMEKLKLDTLAECSIRCRHDLLPR